MVCLLRFTSLISIFLFSVSSKAAESIDISYLEKAKNHQVIIIDNWESEILKKEDEASSRGVCSGSISSVNNSRWLKAQFSKKLSSQCLQKIKNRIEILEYQTKLQ